MDGIKKCVSQLSQLEMLYFHLDLRFFEASFTITTNIKINYGTSLVVQWLRLRASTAGGMGSIPGQGTKILHAMRRGPQK